MATQLNPGDVEVALVTLLTDKLSGGSTQISALSSAHVDPSTGTLIINPPAVLLLLDTGEDTPGGDNQRTDYESQQNWLALVGDRNLQGEDKERAEALESLGKVRDALAGARLTLPDGRTAPIVLAGFERFQFDAEGTWYAQKFIVTMTAQFTVKQ